MAAAAAACKAYSAEQQSVIDRVVARGESLFVTGDAGSGKSYTLEGVRSAARARGKCVGVTSSTGVSAMLIGGVTLHSYLWLGIGTETASVMAHKMRFNPYCTKTDILIIDEVSMVSAELLEKISAALCIVRRCPERPFGGMTVLAFGDFAQLPPVFTGGAEQDKRLAFESSVWQELFPPATGCVRLTTIFRQKNAGFIDLLRDLRAGTVSAASRATIDACARDLPVVNGIKPTILYSTRDDVDGENARQLHQLEGEKSVTFTADDYTAKPGFKIDSVFQARRTLELRVGAQVMLIRNKPLLDLVNGSRGVVESIDKEKRSIRVTFVDGETLEFTGELFESKNSHGVLIASRRQLPFILAWAQTIHKAQGQTLDRVTMDLRGCFECGQVYVAVSRARSLDGMQITGFSPSLVKCDARVSQYMTLLTSSPRSAAASVAAGVAKSYTPVPAAAAAAASASVPKRKEPAPLSDAAVLAWYAAQHGSTVEEIRKQASVAKRARLDA